MQAVTDAIAKIGVLPDGKKVTDMNYSKVFVNKPKVDK
jgi:Holliday junction resolvase RusA-like endonuclease